MHISFSVDNTSVHQVIVSIGGVLALMESVLNDYNEIELFPKVKIILMDLENKGIFMKRRPSDMETYHVNEVWYESYRDKSDFSGDNKNDIDWT